MAGMHAILCCFDEFSGSPHTLLVKRHSSKTAEGCYRTLFVINVPSYCNEDGLRNIFSDCGYITAVHVVDRPGDFDVFSNKSKVLKYAAKKANTFKFGYIVFKHENSIDTALQMSSSVVRYMSTKENPLETGIDKWIKDYKKIYPDKNEIQEDVDEFMKKFDQKQLEEKEATKNDGDPDDDGWVTIPVSTKNTNKLNDTKEKRKNKKLEKQKRSEKELMNFYMFQQREAKRDKIADLRQKFEEDKKRITQMRQQRKFKPF